MSNDDNDYLLPNMVMAQNDAQIEATSGDESDADVHDIPALV